MAKIRTPAHVITAMISSRSAWQRKRSGAKSSEAVLTWYISVVKKGQVPDKKVLLFVGLALEHELNTTEISKSELSAISNDGESSLNATEVLTVIDAVS